jgi:spermidine/putrescine transport system substrate-binding protein
LAQDTINRFQKENKAHLVQSYFNEPGEMLAKLATGVFGYDIAIATSYTVEALAKIGRVKPIKQSKVYNISNIDTKYLHAAYDPQNKYSVPYASTPVLIGYNVKKMQEVGINPNSWAVLFEPKYLKLLKGHVTVLASARNVFAAALLYLHKDPNTNYKQDLDAAYNLIQKATPYWTAFDSDTYYRGLMRGDIWLAMGYSNDFYKTMVDLESSKSIIQIDAQLQKEGNMTEVDNLVIIKSSANDDLSYKFINEVLSKQAQFELAIATGASITNADLGKSIKTTKYWMYPKKIINFKSSPPSTRLFIDELWTEITMTCRK